MLGNKKLRINVDGCPNVVKEMQSYAWEKDGDKPLKKHDHGPDMLRYWCETQIPDWRLAA